MAGKEWGVPEAGGEVGGGGSVYLGKCVHFSLKDMG